MLLVDMLCLTHKISDKLIAYAFGVALFGGTAQLVITWLIKVTNNPAAPALYVLITSLIAIVGILLMRETGGDKELQK